jgi:hypothetical protein
LKFGQRNASVRILDPSPIRISIRQGKT